VVQTSAFSKNALVHQAVFTRLYGLMMLNAQWKMNLIENF